MATNLGSRASPISIAPMAYPTRRAAVPREADQRHSRRQVEDCGNRAGDSGQQYCDAAHVEGSLHAAKVCGAQACARKPVELQPPRCWLLCRLLRSRSGTPEEGAMNSWSRMGLRPGATPRTQGDQTTGRRERAECRALQGARRQRSPPQWLWGSPAASKGRKRAA